MQEGVVRKAQRMVIERALGGRPTIKALQNCLKLHLPASYTSVTLLTSIVVTYSQFDSNIRVFYVFLGFFRNTLKYFIQRPIFKPLYFYNDFFKILENTSF